jgi:hypothetical protein
MSFSWKLRHAAVVAWASLIGLGMGWMERYENTPGPVSASARQWPKESRLTLSSDRLTVIVFAHPRCPCTSATLSELAQLLARESARVQATLVSTVPESQLHAWAQTRLLSEAVRVPGLRIETDVDGVEARRFGSTTSGYVVAYSPDGRLRFAGGITAARGEIGDNYGLSALEKAAAVVSADYSTTPVFGCELFHPRVPPAN